MATPAVKVVPKFLFAKVTDFDNAKAWPLPEGFYMQVYYVLDEKGALYEKAFANCKVTKDGGVQIYDEFGTLNNKKLSFTAQSFRSMMSEIMSSEGSQFGFVSLAKDPIGTPGGSFLPTPAYLSEQGLPFAFTYTEDKNLENPALFPPMDGEYKAEYFDPTSDKPVAIEVYIVQNKAFTQLAVDAEGKLVSSTAVPAEDVKKKIKTQISKGGKVVFTSIKITKDEETLKDEKKGMSPLVIGALVIGGIYLLTRKKG